METRWTARGLFSNQSFRKVTMGLSEEIRTQMPERAASHWDVGRNAPSRQPASTESKLPTRYRRSTESPVNQQNRKHLVVLGSTSVERDANTMTQLFREAFEIKQHTKECVTFFDKNRRDDDRLTLLIVACQGSGKDIPTQLQVATLLLEETEILTSIDRSYEPSSTLLVNETIGTWKQDFARLVVLGLHGGGRLILMTPTLLESKEGRHLYGRVSLRSSKDDAMSGGRLSTTAVVDDSILDEIEGEYAIGHKERSGSLLTPRATDSNTQRSFESLSLSVLGESKEMISGVLLNTHAPISIETDLFIGKMAIIARPSDLEDDTIYDEKIFPNRFSLQLQGRFRQPPRGTLYAGVELIEMMDAGVMMQTFAGTILRKLQKTNPDMNYSFGDLQNAERPHIVMPAWTLFDRVVITKSPCVPPPLDKPFPESPASISARRASGSKGEWRTRDIFSLAIFSSILDISNWQLKGLHGMDDIGLRQLCRDSPLRLVLYDRSERDLHLHEYNNYAFALEIKNHGEDPSLEYASNDWPAWKKVRVLGDLDERSGDDTDCERWSEDPSDSKLQTVMKARTALLEASQELLDKSDSFCPAWIEMLSPGGNTYSTHFAFNVNRGTRVVFRTADEFHMYFDTKESEMSVSSLCSPRLSTLETERRVLGLCLSQQHGTIGSKLRQFSSHKAYYDSKFLQRSDADSIVVDGDNVAKSGYAARSIGDRHWREELLQLVGGTILFSHPGQKATSLCIHLRNIVSAARLDDEDESPCFPQYSFLSVSTVGRTTYLMFATVSERDDWASVLEAAGVEGDNLVQHIDEVASGESEEGSDPEVLVAFSDFSDEDNTVMIGPDHLLGIEDPSGEFLQESTMWECGQRRVMNCRKLSFRRPPEEMNALTAVEEAMELIYQVQAASMEEFIVSFLDATTRLKDVRTSSLTEEERLVFYTNLYHLMVMHISIIFGAPQSSAEMIEIFGMASYQVSDDVFTLMELEHCIIRAPMSSPTHAPKAVVAPKSCYRDALITPDYRINFVLNNGSTSNPARIPSFKTDILEMQLETASLQALEHVRLERSDGGRYTILLPRVCQWYALDFGGKGSIMDVLRTIDRYFEDDRSPLLREAMEAGAARIDVSYMPFTFKCRQITLQNVRRRRSMNL